MTRPLLLLSLATLGTVATLTDARRERESAPQPVLAQPVLPRVLVRRIEFRATGGEVRCRPLLVWL